MEESLSHDFVAHTSGVSSTVRAYLNLIKPRIAILVTVVNSLVFFLATRGVFPYEVFLITLAGTALSCSGSAVLNNYLEREIDKDMLRTRGRPLPRGEISPANALSLGVLLVVIGTSLLAWRVNLLSGFLALLTAFLYVIVYTPLKRLTWLNTSIGAVPGALPALGAWAAATGELSTDAWLIFLIMFVWQHPHFYSIAWLYRDDYKRAGFQMLSVVDSEDGRATFRHIVFFSILLIPVSLLPTMVGMTGKAYAVGACALSTSLLVMGIILARSRSTRDAWKLFKASVIYLPVLFLLIVADLSG